jgi:hypothetical protein
MATSGYTGCKVFTATKFQDRERLGEAITAWLGANQGVEIVDTVTLQSSDSQFHCLSCLIFYGPGAKAA